MGKQSKTYNDVIARNLQEIRILAEVILKQSGWLPGTCKTAKGAKKCTQRKNSLFFQNVRMAARCTRFLLKYS